MKTHKIFWASMIISGLWCAYIIFLEMTRYTNQNFLLAMAGLFAMFFITYQILRILQYIPDRLEKQETVRRPEKRIDDLLHGLNEDQLDVLRQRLIDDDGGEYETFGDLLVESEQGKRKSR